MSAFCREKVDVFAAFILHSHFSMFQDVSQPFGYIQFSQSIIKRSIHLRTPDKNGREEQRHCMQTLFGRFYQMRNQIQRRQRSSCFPYPLRKILRFEEHIEV